MYSPKTIEGFPEYLVDIDGMIYTERTGLPRRPSMTGGGNLKVTLYRNGVPHTRSVGLLVAKAHLYNDFDPEIFDTPIHLDNDEKNNHVDNLAWRPRWFALAYRRQYWNVEYRYARIRVEELPLGVEYETPMEACQRYGLLFVDVLNSCTSHDKGITNEVFPTRKTFRFS